MAGGLHGVGASVVNALSEWLRVSVHKNGNIYEMKFCPGRHHPGHEASSARPTTPAPQVTFKPDPEMFDTTGLRLSNRCTSACGRRPS